MMGINVTPRSESEDSEDCVSEYVCQNDTEEEAIVSAHLTLPVNGLTTT